MRGIRAVLAVALLAACSSTARSASAPTTVAAARCTSTTLAGKHEFMYGGMRRSYRLALPANDGQHHPLLLALHGFASSSTQF
jgi:poly(3-hydroxybutyrate) depolymerase